LAAVDLSVRVLAKTLLHLPGQHLGLGHHRGQHGDQRRGAGRISRDHRGSGGQLLRTQRGPDFRRGSSQVALPAGLAEQRLDPGLGQLAALLGARDGGQYRQRVTIGEIGAERNQRGTFLLDLNVAREDKARALNRLARETPDCLPNFEMQCQTVRGWLGNSEAGKASVFALA
jgi:hypothetical protein